MRQLLDSIGIPALACLLACSRDARPPEGENHASTPAVTSATPAVVTPAAPEPAPSATEPQAASADPGEMERTPDIEYVPTPQNVVDKMLEVAKVGKTDVLYDLGCGDGRIVVTAAKQFGVKAFGFDIDPQRIKESKENAKKAGERTSSPSSRRTSSRSISPLRPSSRSTSCPS